MSSVVTTSTPAKKPKPAAPQRRNKRAKWLSVLVIIAACALAGWLVTLLYRRAYTGVKADVPTVKVQRGDISLSIFARGEVRGGNSQQLTAPMTGGTELHIRFLSPNGEQVKAGQMVVQFDTTEQEFALKEAEADLAEAKQHIQQAGAQLEADAEDDRYALEKARSDLELAELEARKNPILPAITAKQNDLAISVARDKFAQLGQDGANKKATDQAGVQIQQAAQGKAEAKVFTAKQNIEAMTLKAQRDGYVAIKQNANVNMIFSGMQLPDFQVGDAARPGMAVAEIPDLSHWEVAANIGELDRGHLAQGDPVNVSIVALPGHKLHGRVTDIGSTSGMPWDRHFECKLALDDSTPELRPGMSAKVEITTETMHNALWLPAQALFESDGKMFVYLRSGNTFARKDVTLVRRNETRVIITGIEAGQEVALVNPTDAASKKDQKGKGPMEVLPK